MDRSFRLFAKRCIRSVRRCMTRIAKSLSGAFRRLWLSHFFVQALNWIGAAWSEVTRWYIPPARRRRGKQRRTPRSLSHVCLRGEALEARRCLSSLYWDGASGQRGNGVRLKLSTIGATTLYAYDNGWKYTMAV